MEAVDIDELYDWFKQTVDQCTSGNFHRSDTELEYLIFEELDVNVISFLHETSLSKLLRADYITDEQKDLAIDLRERVIDVLKEDRDIFCVRNDNRWAEIFSLGDKLNTLVGEKGK